MTFVETSDGLIPLSRVIRARVRWRESQVDIAYDAGGEDAQETVASKAAWDLALRNCVTPFAAPAGATALHPPDAAGDYFRTIIIAFGLGADGIFYPVTADGVNDGVDCDLAIQLADGKVVTASGAYDDVDAWLAATRPAPPKREDLL